MNIEKDIGGRMILMTRSLKIMPAGLKFPDLRLD